jgi:hypothetical protein
VGDDVVMTAVGASNVPEPIRRLHSLADPDYADVFTLMTSRATDRSGEAWARAVLEDTPIGRSAPRLWRLLGLRLGPRSSPDYVQGWRIADRGDGWIRIEATSWFMTAHAVVHVDDGRVSVALFLRYERAIAALIWPPVSVMHRRAVPVMLRQALRLDGSRGHQLSRDAVPPSQPTGRPRPQDEW